MILCDSIPGIATGGLQPGILGHGQAQARRHQDGGAVELAFGRTCRHFLIVPRYSLVISVRRLDPGIPTHSVGSGNVWIRSGDADDEEEKSWRHPNPYPDPVPIVPQWQRT
jgi:hypothetical protein